MKTTLLLCLSLLVGSCQPSIEEKSKYTEYCKSIGRYSVYDGQMYQEFQAIKIDSCEYLFMLYNNKTIIPETATHKGDCTNPVHTIK